MSKKPTIKVATGGKVAWVVGKGYVALDDALALADAGWTVYDYGKLGKALVVGKKAA